MSGFNDTYIDTFEDMNARGASVPDGGTFWTRPFVVKNYGVNGVFGLYVDCEGSGALEISYQTDPGEESGEPKDRPYDWFTPDYRNPVKSGVAAGRIAVPMVIVVCKYVRFGIKVSGGAVTINNLRLCYE